MNVREIMTTDITKATPENTLVEIATIMRDEDIGAVPVVNDDELIGIVTDRDIVVRALADGKDPSTTQVEEVISEEIESVGPDTDVTDAADLMASRQIRRLPVVEEGHLVVWFLLAILRSSMRKALPAMPSKEFLRVSKLRTVPPGPPPRSCDPRARLGAQSKSRRGRQRLVARPRRGLRRRTRDSSV